MRRLLFLILLPALLYSQSFPVRVRLEVDTIKTLTQPSILNILDSLRVVGTGLFTGNVTLDADLAVNGDDITTDAALNITPASGNVTMTRADGAGFYSIIGANYGQQNGVILQSQGNPEWGMFKATSGRFEVYNYNTANQALYIDSVDSDVHLVADLDVLGGDIVSPADLTITPAGGDVSVVGKATFSSDVTVGDTLFGAHAVYLGTGGYPKVIFYDPDGLNTGTLGVTTLTNTRTYNLPDTSGIVALANGGQNVSLGSGLFADSVTVYDKSNNDAVSVRFDNSAGVVKGNLYTGVDAGSVASWQLPAEISGMVALTDGGQNFTSVGSITPSGAGKDIGTLAVPFRYLYSDSVRVQKIQFKGAAETTVQPGTIRWDSTQRTFKGYQYVVDRSFAMNHGVHVDSLYISGTTNETDIDTVIVGANYPVAGKVVETKMLGKYNATGGGSKTFIFRVRRSGVMIDSVTVTTAAGGSSSERLELVHTLGFRSVGASGTVRSDVRVISENGTKMNGMTLYSIPTTSANLFIISVQMSDATAGNDFQRETTFTTTIN